jgi:uncharacterized membrane protein (UPF0127 family)
MKPNNTKPPSSWRRIGWPGFIMVGLVLLASICWGLWRREPTITKKTAIVHLQQQTWRVLVADTPAAITRGLSDVPKLTADGMLFVLPQPGQPRFWMYHMLFPLDFIWINQNKVVDILTDVPAPPPGASPANIVIVAPTTTVTHVLEVPAGFVSAHKIKVGDTFSY